MNESSELKWKPAAVTELTLRQLGVTISQITKSRDAYLTHTMSPNDQEFVKTTLKAHRESSSRPNKTLSLHRISLNWEPATNVMNELQNAGYWRGVIRIARDSFIIFFNERELRPVCYEGAFRKYFRNSFPLSVGSSIPSSWMPGKCSIQYLEYRGVSRQQLEGALIWFKQLPAMKAVNAKFPDREFCAFVLRWLEMDESLEV